MAFFFMTQSEVRTHLVHLLPQQKAIIEGVQLLRLGQLVRGAHEAHKRHLDFL